MLINVGMPDFGSSNRGRFKKVVGYERYKSPIVTAVINTITRSFWSNNLAVHRDFYLIEDHLGLSVATSSSEPSYPTGEYEEDLVWFDNETAVLKVFASPFTATPVVTLEVQPASGYENINCFFELIDDSTIIVGTSAPFSGSIKYRAIYGATYPVIVQRSPLLPSMYYTASAGKVSVVSSNTFTGSFASFGSVPSDVFVTGYDIIGNGTANVGFIPTNTFDDTAVSGDLSSYLTNVIEFMAVK